MVKWCCVAGVYTASRRALLMSEVTILHLMTHVLLIIPAYPCIPSKVMASQSLSYTQT